MCLPKGSRRRPEANPRGERARFFFKILRDISISRVDFLGGFIVIPFLHAHRETTRFFEIFDDGHAQPYTSRFTYRRAAFFNTLKSKTGLMVARRVHEKERSKGKGTLISNC